MRPVTESVRLVCFKPWIQKRMLELEMQLYVRIFFFKSTNCFYKVDPNVISNFFDLILKDKWKVSPIILHFTKYLINSKCSLEFQTGQKMTPISSCAIIQLFWTQKTSNCHFYLIFSCICSGPNGHTAASSLPSDAAHKAETWREAWIRLITYWSAF